MFVGKMNIKLVSSTCSMLFLLVNLCLIMEVSSRICYICDSSIDERCFNDVNHNDLRYDCAKIITKDSNTVIGSSEQLQALTNAYLNEYEMDGNGSFDCVTFIGKTTVKTVIRGCIPTSKNCRDLESYLIALPFLTESCEPCETDQCNSKSVTKPLQRTIISHQAIIYKNAKNNATVMKFDYRVNLCCAIILLVATFLSSI